MTEKNRCDISQRLMESLTSVTDSYSDFVGGIMNLLEWDDEQAEKMIQFINDNPEAKTDDCIEFLDDYIESLEEEE